MTGERLLALLALRELDADTPAVKRLLIERGFMPGITEAKQRHGKTCIFLELDHDEHWCMAMINTVSDEWALLKLKKSKATQMEAEELFNWFIDWLNARNHIRHVCIETHRVSKPAIN